MTTLLLIFIALYILWIALMVLLQRRWSRSNNGAFWQTHWWEKIVAYPIFLASFCYMLNGIGLENIVIPTRSNLWHWPEANLQLTIELFFLLYALVSWEENSIIARMDEALSAAGIEERYDPITEAVHCLPKLKIRQLLVTVTTLLLSVASSSPSMVIYGVIQYLVYPQWRKYRRSAKPLEF